MNDSKLHWVAFFCNCFFFRCCCFCFSRSRMSLLPPSGSRNRLCVVDTAWSAFHFETEQQLHCSNLKGKKWKVSSSSKKNNKWMRFAFLLLLLLQLMVLVLFLFSWLSLCSLVIQISTSPFLSFYRLHLRWCTLCRLFSIFFVTVFTYTMQYFNQCYSRALSPWDIFEKNGNNFCSTNTIPIGNELISLNWWFFSFEHLT